ncbi:hypothetical protein [Dysgonomonas sp. ZJ279]|uniref:hypothetical protein n=1 Tax=Dysgonomonas sp. ZJ279 TaxID=2709796 RepID=UPI0013ED5BEB|nr:hypothetical protein [Dysgonomonas sp. ZJ279]
MGKEVSLIGVKAIFYGAAISTVATPFVDGDATSGLSPAELKAFLANTETKKVKNIHGDNWNYEKAKASKNYYKNKLTGKNYRSSTDDPGVSKITFSIGKYDFDTKADFEGGNASADKWSAASKYTPKDLTIVALTEDNVYIVYPKADIIAGGVTTDDAVAISIEATALEPDIQLESEVQIHKSAVDSATNP